MRRRTERLFKELARELFAGPVPTQETADNDTCRQ